MLQDEPPKKLLIVEDDPDLVKLLIYNFEKEGYRVLSARSGEKGLELARRERPDVILLDIMLPKMSGFDFCRILRQSSKVPIIFLTAKRSEPDRIMGLKLGADDYVTKPFSIGEIIARVETMLQRVDLGRIDAAGRFEKVRDPGKPIKVLIVDDDEDVVGLMRMALLGAGEDFLIEEAFDGKECIRKLQKTAFDVLILDYKLPEMNGLEVLAKITEAGMDIPVVIVTGVGEERLAERAMRLGAYDCIIKGGEFLAVLPEKLLRAISAHDFKARQGKLLKKLTASEESYRDMVEGSPDIVHSVDAGGRIVATNRKAEELLGYTRDELLEMTIDELYAPEVLDAVHAGFKTLKAQGSLFAVESLLAAKDGRRIAVEISSTARYDERGRFLGTRSILRDITERKRMNDALRASRDYNEAVVASIADALIVLDKDGTVKTVNQSLERLLGYLSHELVGKYGSTLFSGKSNPLKDLAAQGSFAQAESSLRAKDGTDIPVELSGGLLLRCENRKQLNACPTFQKNKTHCGHKIEGTVIAARDMRESRLIKELKKSRHDLVAAQANLVQTEKMALVGQIGAGVAHQLNSPLAGMASVVRSLQKRLGEKGPNAPLLKELGTAVDFCGRVVSDLLTFCRKSTEGSSDIRCGAAVEGVLTFVEHVLELKKIKVVRKFEPELPTVRGDASAITHIFLNIIMNARDAMPDGGTLTITMKGLAPKGSLVEVSFADTGKGIAPEDLPRIFEPLFTKKPGQGPGLGLSIAKELAEKFGGKIRASSRVGCGATFVVSLPTVRA